jgi:hypothetical protein
MATVTPRLGLTKPLTSELYDVGVPNANMDLIDTYIDRVCTKATRPSTAWIGLRVWETDTAAMIVCTGVGPIVWRYITIPVVANAAGRNALSPVHTGMTCTRADKGWTEVYDGTAWRTVGTVAVAAGTEITHPYVDQQVMLLADHRSYRWTGSAWVPIQGTRILGGQLASDLGLAGLVDAPGCTTGAFTMLVAGTAVATIDVAANTVSGNYAQGHLNIDGANHAVMAQASQSGLAPGHASKTVGPIALAAGSHTIKMQLVNSGGATTVKAFSTRISVTIVEG